MVARRLAGGSGRSGRGPDVGVAMLTSAAGGRDRRPGGRPGPPGRRSRPPAALVSMATPTSGPRPDLPLPPASRLATMKITIYGWSTSLIRHVLAWEEGGRGLARGSEGLRP